MNGRETDGHGAGDRISVGSPGGAGYGQAMNTVPLSAIEDAWHDLYDTTEERAGELMDAFAREQPELAHYLTGAEEEISTLDDRGFLMLYGVWTWLAFKLNGRDRTMVTASAIDAAANRNYEDMSRMGSDSGKLIMDASAGFRKEFRQMPMLGAILNDVAEGQLESDHRSDDITGMIILCTKTVIDCLDA